MLKTWPVYLKHFVDDRTEELAEKLLFHERKYIQLKKRAFQAVEQLKAGIGSEASELYNQYDSAEGDLYAYKCDFFYKNGLIDGLRLGRLIDRIRNE
jgi:hypothetical protein